MVGMLIDSSVYAALFNTQDVLHKATLDFTAGLNERETRVILPRLVLIEVTNVLYRRGVLDLELLERSMSDAVLVELTESVHEEVRLLLEKVSLKTADLLLVAWAKLYEVELVSWDRQLVREANKVVRAYTPKDR